MLTDRRFLTFAMIALLCLIVTAGCRKRSSGHSSYSGDSGDIFTTDSFPGPSVQDGNVADDGRAFSPSGESFAGDLICTPNGARGTCMVTYRTDTGQVYAQHFDGGGWTPPVALGAIDAVMAGAGAFAFNIVHSFLNTATQASESAQDRDGDCIIFWRGKDADDDGAGPDGANICLFATYFDTTLRGDALKNYGFQALATRINSEDELDESVYTVALVTDGLRGEARWSRRGHSYEYGDETTSIVVAFIEEDQNGSAGEFDPKVHAVRFDPAEALPADVPLTPSADTVVPALTFGASDSGVDARESVVEFEFITYNATLFFKVLSDSSVEYGSGGGFDFAEYRNFGQAFVGPGEDATIQTTTFQLATTTFSPAAALNFGTVDSTDGDNNIAEFLKEDNPVGALFPFTHTFLGSRRSVYGSDEGLANVAIFYVTLTEDPDADTEWGQGLAGDPEEDGRVAIAEIDQATGGLIHSGVVNFTDADLFGVNGDGVDEGDVDTRVSRNGDYIWVAWLQRSDSGPSDEVALHVAQYQTTLLPEDSGDPIPVPPVLADSLSADFTVNPDTDLETVHWFAFQDNLGFVCGIQSDPDVMNVFYEQSRDDGSDVADEVFFTRLTADTKGFPLTVPTVTAGASWEVFEEGDQSGAGRINNERLNFNATDSGEGGNVFTVYREDVGGVAADDFRLWSEANGLNAGRIEIDSAVDYRQVPSQGLKLVSTPAGSEIGRYDTAGGVDSDARPHAAGTIHVFFAENKTTETSGFGNALRTRRWSTDTDLGAAYGDRFFPVATAGPTFGTPFDLDLPALDPPAATDAGVVGVAECGDQVGIWFTELGHLYYQEFNASSGNELGWYNVGGASDPKLVDDDNDEAIDAFVDFCAPTGSCCNLEGTLVFWTKSYGSLGAVTSRLQVRVRSGD